MGLFTCQKSELHMPTPLSQINAKHFPLIKDVLTWTAPALLIPAFRYFQDPPQQRKELFLRDASTYSVGAGLFLGLGLLSRKLLNRWGTFKNPASKDLAAFLIALGANILYAGVGAVHFSRRFSRKHNLQDPSFATGPSSASPTSISSKSTNPLYFSEFGRMQYLA